MSKSSPPKIIVIGSLNTDMVATGVTKFPKPGEHVYGKELVIGPGGKSRNIADMISHLAPDSGVAMVGRTVRDPYGLWKVPVEALKKAGVNIDYIQVAEYGETKKLPGIAIIPVDEQGNNQIFVLPGISNDFSITDVEAASELFEAAGRNNGMLALTLEFPLDVATYAVRMAGKVGLKVMFDPGGLEAGTDLSELIKSGVYLIKPNEHEAQMLTGVEVADLASAKKAAKKLMDMGAQNVMITVGSQGAYLITSDSSEHLPIPNVEGGESRDETGCGDQTMAALCAMLESGKPLDEAAEIAVLAGTLQFHKSGIQPVTVAELAKYTS